MQAPALLASRNVIVATIIRLIVKLGMLREMKNIFVAVASAAKSILR